MSLVWKEGQLVRATKTIIENDQELNPDAEPCKPGWCHAHEGEEGEVVYVDPDSGIPTVRFRLTGTATICYSDELELLQ